MSTRPPHLDAIGTSRPSHRTAEHSPRPGGVGFRRSRVSQTIASARAALMAMTAHLAQQDPHGRSGQRTGAGSNQAQRIRSARESQEWLGHCLSAIAVQLELANALHRHGRDDEANAATRQARSLAVDGIAETGRAIHVLSGHTSACSVDRT